MQTPRIAVVGSANIDLVTFTDKFPKPGQTIFGDRFDLGFGGKGANQAVAARLCGAQVDMVAKVGDDLFGPATIRNLQFVRHRYDPRPYRARYFKRSRADLRRLDGTTSDSLTRTGLPVVYEFTYDIIHNWIPEVDPKNWTGT